MNEGKEPKETMFKSLGGLLPICTVMILVLGIAKQVLYYNNYYLPIKYFLGLSELGLIISDDLLLITPLLIVLLITVKIIGIKIENKNALLNTIDNKTSKVHNRSKQMAISICIFGICLSIFIFFFFSIYAMKLAATAAFLLLLFLLISVTNLDELVKHVFISSNTLLAFTTFIALAAFMILKTSFEILDVEKNHRYTGTIVKTTDSTYVSSDSSYFIGKTEKYVFIYNIKNKATDIIPTESIKHLIMKSK